MHRLIVELICPLADVFFPTHEEDCEDSDDDSGQEDSNSDEDERGSSDQRQVENESKEVEGGYEFVNVPPPTEKREVEPQTLTPHLLDTHARMNHNTKAQVIMLEILCKTFFLHLKSVLPRPVSLPFSFALVLIKKNYLYILKNVYLFLYCLPLRFFVILLLFLNLNSGRRPVLRRILPSTRFGIGY